MIANEFSSGNFLMDNIQLKIKSLMAMLSEIKEPSNDNEFDLAICNDIYAYVQNIQTDCQRIINNDKYDLFLNKNRINQNINGNYNSIPIRYLKKTININFFK